MAEKVIEHLKKFLELLIMVAEKIKEFLCEELVMKKSYGKSRRIKSYGASRGGIRL